MRVLYPPVTDNEFEKMIPVTSRQPLSKTLPILMIFIVVSAVGMYYHELFLDEVQHFLIGRDSASLSSMYWNMRYDGHPRLWNACLYLITHFITPHYAGMQVFHLLLTSLAAYILLSYAPFNLLTKLLILSGYYFLFEYNVLSRNYGPGICLLFIALVLLARLEKNMQDDANKIVTERRDKNLLYLGGVILLMCNMHLFFTFASIGIYLSVLYGGFQNGMWRRGDFLLFSGMFLLGVVAAVLQFQTPAEDNFFQFGTARWLHGQNFFFSTRALVKGWLPMPQSSGGHFWNSYWLNEGRVPAWGWSVLFMGLTLFPWAVLRDSRKALIFYYSSLAPLLFFFVVTNFTASRYFGMVYVYFLAAVWMKGGIVTVPPLLKAAIYFIFCLHVVIGVYALSDDILHPFSGSRDAAAFLSGHGLAGERLAVDGCIAGPMLCAYLDKKVYYLDIDQVGSYLTWKKSWFPPHRRSIEDEIKGSTHIRDWQDFILVSNRKITNDSLPCSDRGNYYKLKPLAEFENSIVAWEVYYIYQAVKK
jgi:hypothetical protein